VKEKTRNNKLILLLISVLFITSCSTKKKTYVSRKYHNITAKYNGYFNGNESLKYGIKKLEESNTDDYLNILPVFEHSEIITSKTHHSYMDKSIQKGSVVIQKHSINIKNKEYCKWIDDSYFLVAKAYYFKGEYIEAKKTFNFIKNKYKKTEIAFEAELWTAKCYISLEDYHSAESILDELQLKKKFPEKLEKDLHLTFADLYIKQEIFSDALDELKSACSLIKRERKKARYYYIIAQIYQDAGNSKQSKKYYELVLGANPEYDMVFNAKMNLARTLRNKKDLAQMKEKLLKMIRDEKNKDYLDQIYFTLGEMNIVEKDTTTAIENYTLSTKHSVENDIQKSLSFLQLGQIYYNKSEYPTSKVFYDSAYTFMPESHQFYESTKKTQKVLEELIYHLNTISLEDSLQKLASMSVNERKNIIQSVIAEVIKKEQEKIRDQQSRGSRGIIGRDGRNENFGNATSGGKWYFYNPATLSFGMSEFRKKWGKRKLEDNWRRTNKKSLSTIDGDSTSLNTTRENESENLKSEKYYLDQIPLTKQKIKESNNKIITAYYESSIIYKDNLEELRKSEKMLEGLVKRFPDHKELTPLSYYLIYNLQTENRSLKKAAKTKQSLITRFPESNYAKFLLDTNYINSVLSKNKQKEDDYKKIFSLYEKDSFNLSYEKSLKKLNQLQNTKESNYSPKYFLINILSEFKINNDTTNFISKLKKGEEEYKTSEIKDRFTEILFLLGNTNQINERNTTAILKTPYRYKENTSHYLLFIIPKENTDITYLKTLVSDFNSRSYSSDIFEINSMMLGLEKHILLIKTFENANKVSKYKNTIDSDKSIKKELEKSEYITIIISQDNYPEFYKNKDTEGYSKFFNNNYLK
jgi:tetratricopeptide (TPR) repeat protein